MKNKIYLIISLVVLTLILVIGGTYAWFSSRIEGNGAQIVITTDELKLIYTDSLAINNESIEPGWSITKTFTVENTTNEEKYYKIVWKDLVNTFVNTNDLTITITSTNGGGNLEKTPIQSSSTPGNYDIIPGVTIAGKTVQEYTVTFEYANTDEDQSADMGKTFSGSIEINLLESDYNKKYLYAKILEDNPNVETRTDFSTIFTTSNNGNTIYKASGQDGKDTYYFAGTVTNNYVKFGTNSSGQELWWRIVRINEDNSVRLIYAGTSATDTAAFISSSQVFNVNYNKSIYSGYMYSSGEQHGTDESSSIKEVVDNWYANNLNNYDSYISKTAIYCSDRTVANGGWSEAGNNFNYNTYERIVTNKTPNFNCDVLNDRLTSSTTIGNGALTYPIGLITADEIAYAGGAYGTANSSYYIAQNAKTGAAYWWTMSADYWYNNFTYVLRIGGYTDTGSLTNNNVYNGLGVRPVISLKACIQYSNGNGTASDPYTVELADECANVENEILEGNTVRVSATTNDTGMASVNAPSSVIINSGSSHTFTITVKDGYEYESVTGCNGTYDTSTNQLTVSNVTSSTTCKVNFKEYIPYLYKTILKNNPNVETRTDFSKVFTTSNNGNTIYKASGQDDKDTYYFAGNVTNNYVSFGGYYWRIVRINEDNSVRLIYAGTSTGDTAAFISTSQAYNTTYNNSSYVGYMYTLNEQHGTSTNSSIKTVLDNWYANNLNNYDNYISKTAIYCNDRTVTDGTWNASGGSLYYASYTRLADEKSPTYVCDNENDKFTASTNSGNGSLAYPIGLITADEVAYAGGLYGTKNSNFYIIQNANTGASYWWTMSPIDILGGFSRIFFVDSFYNIGNMNGSYVFNSYAVRPVISLKSCVQYNSGDGTASNPYTVSINGTCSSAEN